MIGYLVTRAHSYTMQSFLEGYGRGLAERIMVVAYEQLLADRKLPGFSSVIFSDLDRLPEGVRADLGALHDQLRAQNPRCMVLNHPLRSLSRHDLLRELSRQGINDFDACRLRDRELPRRFPVILRAEPGFARGDLPLVRDAAEVEALFVRMDAAPDQFADSLLVGFCDTADATGLYRKYGAFVVGRHIVPRHLFFSRHWLVKLADLEEDALLAEERAYIEANPHAAQLLDICDRAGIGYGRIDYSLLDGRVQIWEINTNPLLVSKLGMRIEARDRVHRRFAELVTAAFQSVDGGRTGRTA